MKKGWFRTILNWMAIVATVSIWINMIRQGKNLMAAKQKVMENEVEISRLVEENTIFKQRIEYSTSSAYLDQEARDKLGLGGANDYWLILPPEDKEIDLYPKINEMIRKPAWRQWWELLMGEKEKPLK